MLRAKFKRANAIELEYTQGEAFDSDKENDDEDTKEVNLWRPEETISIPVSHVTHICQ